MKFKELIILYESYIPPDSVAKAAKRGLESRKKASESKQGGLTNKEASKHGIGSGVQRAVNLSNKNSLSLSTIKRMKSFFDRHEGNYKKAKSKKLKPSESRAIQAWLLWGGNAGKAWANKMIKKHNKKKED